MQIGSSLFDILSRLQPSTVNTSLSRLTAPSQGEPIILADSLLQLLADETTTDETAAIETPETVGDIIAEPVDPDVSTDVPATDTDEPTTTDDVLPPSPAPDSDEEEARGVVRLLQSGHFKGVADLRLRLNHFDELSHESLPAVEPAKGNGKAYNKFLAEYDAKFAPATPEVDEVA
ncbi:MAG TPA: hypothetical protein VJZ71_15920 [Phycisphaerae bacterium]|nr:hypothetical protein [Phycisphaerae bacterium]